MDPPWRSSLCTLYTMNLKEQTRCNFPLLSILEQLYAWNNLPNNLCIEENIAAIVYKNKHTKEMLWIAKNYCVIYLDLYVY